MTACFVTHQGTLLCFGEDETDFRHVAVADLDEATLVVADAPSDALRAGLLAGQPVLLRPAATGRSGLPRSVGIGTTGRGSTVSLDWREAHLCAGASGGNINFSDRVAAWEEFLPIPREDVALLRDFGRGTWETARGGRLKTGSIRLGPDFVLEAGGTPIDLRRQATLGGEAAVVSGRTAFVVDGWRVETLRRFEPMVVWRHDGSDEADEEVVLGLRSMASGGDYHGALHVETRLDRDELLRRCGLDGAGLRTSRPPDGSCGLLPWSRGLDAGEMERGPILLLANGVTCHRGLEPLLRALAATAEVALLPWVWAEGQSGSEMAALFAGDLAEEAHGRACSGAVVGLPDLRRTATIERLVASIVADRTTPPTGADEDALLRYVWARVGGASTDLLSNFAGTQAPTLTNHRALPAAVRADAMRDLLGGRAG